jgi:hypothetical protein
LVSLYLAGFACEFGGVVLVAVEIWRDIGTAKKLVEPQPVPQGIAHESPGVQTFIGGAFGQVLAGTMQGIDTFREFALERLTGGIRLRVLGVVLILLGAILGLIANIGSLR